MFDLDLSSLLKTPIKETNQVFILNDTIITFKPTTARVRDYVDMTLESMNAINVFVDDDGNPLPIVTDEEGNIIGVKDSIKIYLPDIDPTAALKAIKAKQDYYDSDSVKTATVVQSKPAYFYTASYHNSRIGDTLRVMDITELSLKEMLKLDVIVGGQSFINLLQTSSNTLIVDNEALKRGGFDNLSEALSFISSLNLFDDDYKLSGVVRGSPASNFNDFIVMQNGRVLNSLYSNEAYLSNQFGIQNIQQIEIIYGAGSADYPSNLYSGAINIITKDFAVESENIEIQGSIATPFRTTAALSIGKNAGKLNFNANARYIKETIIHEDIDQYIKFDDRFAGGAPKNIMTPLDNVNQTIYKNNKQAISFDAHLSLLNVYIGTNFYRNEVGQSGLRNLSLSYDNANEEKHQFLQSYLGFNKLFGENNRFNTEYQFTKENISGNETNIWVDYNRYENNHTEEPITEQEANEYFTKYYSQDGTIGSTKHTGIARLFILLPILTDRPFFKGDFSFSTGYEGGYNDILGLSTGNSLPLEDFNLEKSEDNYMRLPQYSFMTQDAFALVRKSIFNERLFLSLGARYSWHENYRSALLIRSEASFKLGSKTYIKGGYNESVLRPAVSQMLEYNQSGDWAFNSDLKSAKSSTANVGFVHTHKEFLTIRTNVFRATFEDNIFPTITSWENNDTLLTTIGIEFKSSLKINDIIFNTDYTFQKQLESDLNYYPHNLVLSGNYFAHKYVGINIAYLYSSKLKTLNDYTNSVIELSGQSTVNLSVSSHEVPIGNSGSFEIICSFKNLFNTELLYPNVNSFGSSVFLGRGRSISGKIILKF